MTETPLIPDEPLLSMRRVWFGMMLWLWMWRDGLYISFWRMVWYHRRPYATHLHDEKRRAA